MSGSDGITGAADMPAEHAQHLFSPLELTQPADIVQN